MNEAHVSESNLIERIERLEKSNRKLLRQNHLARAAFCITCLGFTILLALGGASAAKNDITCKSITAEQLVVVDADGNEVIKLGTSEEGTGLAVYTTDGKKALALGLDAKGTSSGLAILDSDENARIGLGMDEAVPSLAFCDAAGKKLIALGLGEERYGIAVLDKDEVTRVGMGMGSKGPLCCIMDATGAPRAGMAQDANGAFQLAIIDDDGVERSLD